MRPHPDLSPFLRSRRARLRPADAGLPDYGGRRRVPGLRREELAQLAGISPGYYTRLEQGQTSRVSEAVLDAVARALRLDEAERTHLRALVRPARTDSAPARTESVRPGVRTLLDSLGATPALVLGDRVDIVAWNAGAHALLAGHLPFDEPPNAARLVFLDPAARRLFGEGWPVKCRDTVADLRLIAGRRPGDRALAALIAELAERSPEFSALWRTHPVAGCPSHVRRYRHPTVGPLTLTHQLLDLGDGSGQRLALYAAEPGSASAAALARLAAGVTAGRPSSGRGPGPAAG
ncbi:XRE family transcriptional regulator [Streptomyces sp. 8K308]|uniref:helix-turn-helix transcriptional regulator n=1 Tax=Streptomyces sp. 8K308 TaxID=2530388 RepID=UPI00104F7C8B|nr:helix-turn-helix transcriptional regulator [Streptomyces sp. 8K308]TDC20789.1 XRE family transcriptional regulator [Streptomyces sp. 8K308]